MVIGVCPRPSVNRLIGICKQSYKHGHLYVYKFLSDNNRHESGSACCIHSRPCLLTINKENKFIKYLLKILIHLLLIMYFTSTYFILIKFFFYSCPLVRPSSSLPTGNSKAASISLSTTTIFWVSGEREADLLQTQKHPTFSPSSSPLQLNESLLHPNPSPSYLRYKFLKDSDSTTPFPISHLPRNPFAAHALF